MERDELSRSVNENTQLPEMPPIENSDSAEVEHETSLPALSPSEGMEAHEEQTAPTESVEVTIDSPHPVRQGMEATVVPKKSRNISDANPNTIAVPWWLRWHTPGATPEKVSTTNSSPPSTCELMSEASELPSTLQAGASSDSTDPTASAHSGVSLRRSSRETHPPSRLVESIMLLGSLPKNYRDAISRPGGEGDKWKDAVQVEQKAMKDNQVWESMTQLPSGATAIPAMWLFSQKVDGRHTARLVALGNKAERSAEASYSAPVAALASLRMLAAKAIHCDYKIHQMDVSNAFLHGELDPGEDIYVRLPEGLQDNRLVRLKRALYGLREAPLLWYRRLRDYLVEIGFSISTVDPCLFTLNKNGEEILICVYVDDLFIASSSDSLTDYVKGKLCTEFPMKDLGTVNTFLGISFTKVSGGLLLHQRDYASKLVDKFQAQVPREFATPLPTDLTPSRNGDQGTMGWSADGYRSAVGGLMWLMCGSRPDLAFAVGWLSRYVANPSCFQYQMLSRVLGYVSRTRRLGLLYRKQATPLLRGSGDADWGTDPETRQSVSGYEFSLGGNLVSWSSRKQKTVALSSCEAEFVAFSEAVREALWLRRLAGELIPQSVAGATEIGQDNQAAISVEKSSTLSQRNKHIQLKVLFSRQAVADRLIKPVYVPTHQMPADIFTKPLPRELFEKHVAGLGMIDCE